MRPYGFFDVSQIFMVLVLVGLPFLFILISTEQVEINITYDYLDELNSCEEELERTSPICPACECSSEGEFGKYLLGFLTGMLVSLIIFSNRDLIFKSKSKNKELGKIKRKGTKE